jgi:ABC-type Zn2+ transport system substrate-binding protein/surface adhesin
MRLLVLFALPHECGCCLLYLGADDRDHDHDHDRDHDSDHDRDHDRDRDHDSDLKYLLCLPRIIFSLSCCRMNAAVVYFI